MVTFGLFLNTGELPRLTHDQIFDLTVAEVDAAEALGLHDAWITEHHFIPFGINSNALTGAAFLLGRTRRLRIGTAVCLVPQYHPVQLAEQAAILDQFSGGRFDFGIGRGGYLREFEVFGVDTARWDVEVANTMRVLLDAWTLDEVSSDTAGVSFGPVKANPRPRTTPHPPLFIATSTSPALEMAAELGLPLMHYFGSPLEGRLKLEADYARSRSALGLAPANVDHLHVVICLVEDDEERARADILQNVTYSYSTGDWPSVPQGQSRRTGPDGKPIDHARFAAMAVEGAMVGPPARVIEQLRDYIERTGAGRIAMFFEPAGDPGRVLRSLERFALEVAPAFATAEMLPGPAPERTAAGSLAL